MLNYQNTAFELLPLLGSAYALIFMVWPPAWLRLTTLHKVSAAAP